MNMETEILLRRARALPADQRRELVLELQRSLESGASQAGEVAERIVAYGAFEPAPPEPAHHSGTPPKGWTSLEPFRAGLGLPTLASNPILDMREDERF